MKSTALIGLILTLINPVFGVEYHEWQWPRASVDLDAYEGLDGSACRSARAQCDRIGGLESKRSIWHLEPDGTKKPTLCVVECYMGKKKL